MNRRRFLKSGALWFPSVAIGSPLSGAKYSAFTTSRSTPLPIPRGWWKLNDGSGTTASDSSGNGINGTLAGSPLPTWNVGSLTFAGGTGTGYVHLMDLGSLLTSYSFSLWFTPNSVPMGNNVTLLQIGKFSENDFRLCRLYSTGNGPKAEATYDNGAGQSDTADNFTEIISTPYNVVVLASPSNLSFYVNGSLYSSVGPAGSSFDSVRYLKFGGTSASNQTVDGTMDDVRVYNSLLSAGDIASIYAAGPQ